MAANPFESNKYAVLLEDLRRPQLIKDRGSFGVSDRRFVGRYKRGEHSHNSSFTSDVTADSALSEGLAAVYRNDPRLGAILSRARLLAGEASFRHET